MYPWLRTSRVNPYCYCHQLTLPRWVHLRLARTLLLLLLHLSVHNEGVAAQCDVHHWDLMCVTLRCTTLSVMAGGASPDQSLLTLRV